MTVHLHIDRVIVDGLPLGEGSERQFRAGLERELTTLFAAQGVPERMREGGATPRISGPPLTLSPNTTSRGIGQGVARSVYSSMSRI